MSSGDMSFICGSCGEVIQTVHTSRYSGGAIPHEKCNSITEFAPTDHPHTPKALDVRPYNFSQSPESPATFTESELAAIEYVKSHGYSQEAAETIVKQEGAERILAEKAREDAEIAENFAREQEKINAVDAKAAKQAETQNAASNLSDAAQNSEGAKDADTSSDGSAPDGNQAVEGKKEKPEPKSRAAR